MPDDAARLTHLLEQIGGHLKQMTPTLAAYYLDLVKEGIPPAQAIELVRDAQARLIGAMPKARP